MLNIHKKLLFFTLTALAVVLCGCVPLLHPSQGTEPSEHSKELLSEAQRLYGDGVIYNMRGQWADAAKTFDEALRIISQIDLENDEAVSEQVDVLLREIAYDYRFTLSQSETLSVESAPVVLSLALSEKPFSELTQKRLQQLMQQLPEQAGDIQFNFPIVWNDRVKEKIIFFQTDAKRPLSRWLGRSYAYLPTIRKILSEEGLPSDLAYLPLIESGFNPNAYSWAHAVGIWQFIKGTARNFGLKVTWWLDERRDPEKSTRAAAKYLKYLYEMFGDWHLALAAYNCGEGRIMRTMKKQGTNNYWKLDLPTQTENYVPLFIAALIIAKSPQKYGFSDVVPQAPLEYDIVWVNEVVDLKLAARCAKTSYDTLRLLNPELVRGCTPPKMERYPLRLPKGTGTHFVEAYKKVPESEKVAWHRHKVKKGESLWTIARRYGTSVQALIDANNIRKSNRLMPGQHLLIPVDRATADRIASSPSRSRTRLSSYTVRKGDSISKIAQKLNVSTSELMSINGLTAKSIIRPGQVLRLPGGTRTVYHKVKKGETLSEIAARNKVKISDILKWNPEIAGKNSIIKIGQKIKLLLPADGIASSKGSSSSSKVKKHTVRPGESLWSIAKRYGVTVSQIKRWNDLKSDRLSVGQRLIIKGGGASSTVAHSNRKKRTTKTHLVKSGESLWSIARKYGVSVSDIKKWNKLSQNSTLHPGQKLVVMTTASSDKRQRKKVVHTVRQGETLWQIARQYRTTIDSIVKNNNLTDPTKLKPGDRLTIIAQ